MTSHKVHFLPKQKSYMDRQIDRIPARQKFLIVCEGEKTEPNYFKKFPIPKSVISVIGTGANTDSLIMETIKLRDQAEQEYDQVWCVFDKDCFPPQNFNRAFELANKNQIKIAYSNEAFELWYILHFCYLDSAVSRHAYSKILTRELKYKYIKKSETIYSELFSKQAIAIRNAKRLYSQYKTKNPVKDKPSTTVHLLVEELNKIIKY